MKSWISKGLIIAVCILLGVIIAIQYKTVNSIVGQGFIPTQKNRELVEELTKLESEKETLMNELTNLENKVKKYENEASQESDYVKELSESLLKYKMFAGYKKVEGPGIEIKINNPEYNGEQTEYTTIVDYYSYLLDIISYLNVSGAEAISINDLRYTSFSEMTIAGDNINFNNKAIGVPIVIKAIGPVENFESTLGMSSSPIDLMEWYGFKIEMTKKDNITIPRYTEIKEFKYARPVSSEE
ncbi:DUF881 domain-containing protein [Clostridium sp. D2Q-11]|uniref:DUF881 domain-containing protein n=1 Tax=Anaeromonas frigoriresistens TaxID=2683708 RepID=A0A942ZA80_9FIRM|nr:DUF881 domain-containing protein [Anaeromonas frigoriresistens]MBS4540083.1 DUF881 domain-containing protein [Anaeromonas frigoriresistens]